MKVAMVTREFPPNTGGIGAYTQKTARALAAAGNEVHVITQADGSEPGLELETGGMLTIHRLPPSRLRPREAQTIHRAVMVARALRRFGPFDIVQACEFEGEASVFSMWKTAPLVTRIATPWYLVDALNGASTADRGRHIVVNTLEKLQTKRSTRVIAPSHAMADEVAREWHMDVDKIAIVPTGIKPPALDFGTIPGALKGKRYALFFGRLEVRKGVDVWLDALPGVLTRHPDLIAVFVGRDVGIGGRSFIDFAKERCGDFWDRIIFLPHLTHAELFPVVAEAAIVVLPSRWENLANVCLEAMVVGSAVVATTGSAFPEMVEDGVTGFLVPPGDAVTLGRVVSDALDDPDQLRAIGEAARERAADFDLDRMVERLTEVHRDVAGLSMSTTP